MKHKNDYSCIVFFETGSPKKWNYVHKLNGFGLFLDKSHPSWKYLNVYERRSGKYLKRFYKGGFIPPFLTLILCFALTIKAFHKPLKIPVASTFIYGIYNTATISTPTGQKGGAKWHS